MDWTHLASWQILGHSALETLLMVTTAGAIAGTFGFLLGLSCFMTENQAFYPHSSIHHALSLLINATRSIPFIILAIALIPLTRFLTGTSIGTTATLVPLSIAGIPYFARVTQMSLHESRPALVEAGLSLGASPLQILKHMLLPEAYPSLIRGLTLLLVSLTEYTAMAGAIGGGGLGKLAIEYGYYRFDTLTLLISLAVIMLLVQWIQWSGDRLTRIWLT